MEREFDGRDNEEERLGTKKISLDPDRIKFLITMPKCHAALFLDDKF